LEPILSRRGGGQHDGGYRPQPPRAKSETPLAVRRRQVEVIVLPVVRTSEKTRYREKQKMETTMESIARFREKHNNDTFIAHLKQKLAEGFKFDFNADKIINATETEKEKQERYQIEKQAWQDTAVENICGG
jgi:hypothetical protein